MIFKIKKNCIYLSGYFGENNFGDNLLLKVLITRIRSCFPQETILVRSKREIDYFSSDKNLLFLQNEYLLHDRGFFKLIYGVLFLFRNIKPIIKSKFFVVGGGGVFLDFQRLNFSLVLLFLLIIISKIFGTKVIIIGVSSDFIVNKLTLFFMQSLLKKADYISVRDWLTHRQFTKMLGFKEKKIHLASDLGWILPLENIQLNNDLLPRIWFNIMPLEYFFGPKHSNKADRVVEHLLKIAKSHPRIGILVTQTSTSFNEGWLFKEFQKIHKNVSYQEIKFEEDFNRVFSSKDTVITSRYHVGLFCVALNVKGVLVDHEMKISSLASEFSIDAIPVEELDQLDVEMFNSKHLIFDKANLLNSQRERSELNFGWLP